MEPSDLEDVSGHHQIPHISCYGVGSSREGDRLATSAGLPLENAASTLRSWPPLVCQVYHRISTRDAESPCSS